ncbi:MAG: phage portal protein [Pseudomonadota bacterium]
MLFNRAQKAQRDRSPAPDETRSAPPLSRPSLPSFGFLSPGTPIWTDTGYASLARQAYCRNPVAYRSVRLVADAAASVPLVLRGREHEYTDHWLLDLISQPGSHLSRTALIETIVAHLMLEGNAYLLGAFHEEKPCELYPLRPDRVRVVAGKDGWPAGYRYSAGETSVEFKPDPRTGMMPVAHIRLFHPLDDHYGLGCLEPARAAIDLHQGANSWNKALLDNAARPSGALVYTGGTGHLDAEMFERLKSELQSTYQGGENAGRPLLLEGGLEWKPMSLSPKEMDFFEARHGAMREIALAFGVPPLLLGLPGDNTYANFAEAQRALWRQTVLPLLGRVLDGLTHWLAPLSPSERLELRPDLDAIEALSVEREALWRRVAAADFLTDAEKRQAVGYGAVPASAEADREHEQTLD